MKTLKMLVIASAIFFCSMQANGQAEPQKPAHEKKVYVNEAGDYFIQKTLPLYLNFSVTPGGQTYVLKSKETAKYANPMYLDTEGINWIRSRWAVDPQTLKTIQPQMEIMYELYADGLAPYTTITLAGAPRYASGGTIYYGKGLSFTLNSSDGVSGVEKTHYSLNSSAYADYSSTVPVGEEREYNLFFYSHDHVGNAETTRKRSFTVDITSPVSAHAINGISYQGNILAPSTKFNLSSTDKLSGVNFISYAYDERQVSVYPGYPVGVSWLSDGNHTLYYYAIDHVKNEESRASFSFYLDKIPPVVSYAIEGDLYEGQYKFISSRTKISLSATDNKAGVESISYSIDGGGDGKYASAFAIPDRIGLHSVNYYGTDNVQNRSGRKSLSVYMDNRAPETGIDYGKPQFFDRDTLFINKTTSISLFSTDYQSGVARVEYAVDDGGFRQYQKFTVDPEGYHKITFKATDRVNNTEQIKESYVFVDNSPPVIYHNFSIEAINTRSKGGKSYNVYPNYTRLYLAATDKYTGTASILYSTDGGKTYMDYSSPYTLDISELNRFAQNKFYTVHIKAKDKLGNESEMTVEFFVGREK